MLKAVEHLREELAAVNVMIAELEKEYTEDELAMHIAKLHEYNEIKDVAQDLLGRLGAFDLASKVPHSHTHLDRRSTSRANNDAVAVPQV